MGWGAGAAAALAASCLLHAAPAAAQAPWRITPTLSGELTYSDNVDLGPRGSEHSDWILSLTPGLSFEHRSPRTELTGSLRLSTFLHANTGALNDRVLPQADILGRAELVENFFFVEASATVAQDYLNPFGLRPDNLVNATDNRYQTETYRVAPWIQGLIGSNVRYMLRDENIWSNPSRAPGVVRSSYANRLNGNIDRNPTPFGWGFDISRSEVKYSDQPSAQVLELARVRAVWQPDPQFRGHVSVGYDTNRFQFTENAGATYGLGFRWRPTERTSVDAQWERRFFGSSYLVAIEHRTPLTVWSLRASRDVTSYPEQLATLPAGGIVPLLLNEILRSRIPDPVQRAAAVAEFMRAQGLPLVLGDPLTIYNQQLTLLELASASAGIVGVRNTVLVTLYRSRSEAVGAEGQLLPSQLVGVSNNTQTGISGIWSYKLTPTAALSLTGNVSRTEADTLVAASSRQSAVRLTLNRPVSPNTQMFAGVRWQKLDTELDADVRETAVFIGLTHTFR